MKDSTLCVLLDKKEDLSYLLETSFGDEILDCKDNSVADYLVSFEKDVQKQPLTKEEIVEKARIEKAIRKGKFLHADETVSMFEAIAGLTLFDEIVTHIIGRFVPVF